METPKIQAKKFTHLLQLSQLSQLSQLIIICTLCLTPLQIFADTTKPTGGEVRKKIGTTTGGEKYLKKNYKTIKVNGKKVNNIPPEDILMRKEVETPLAPKIEGTSIRISLTDQRAWLYEDGKPVLVSSITPGKKSSPTPKGKYHIINKHRHWTSTIYHVPMPYFLRLNPGYFGLHQGQMRVAPASHGCIRLPEKEASEFFALAKIGDPVWIE
jgi:hypothetical protein